VGRLAQIVPKVATVHLVRIARSPASGKTRTLEIAERSSSLPSNQNNLLAPERGRPL